MARRTLAGIVWAACASGCVFGSNSGGGAMLGEGTSSDTGRTTEPATTTGPGAETTAGTMAGDSGGSATETSGGLDEGTSGSTTGEPVTCGLDNGGCDLNATCSVEQDVVVCTCNSGWTGDGQVCESSGVLPGLRFEVACTGSDFGCSNFDGFCTTDTNEATDGTVMQGDRGVTYNVTLSLHGVLSEKAIDGGMTDGYWNVGGTPQTDNWAVVRIDVSDPAETYYVNAGVSGNPYCERIEYERVIPVATGATVTLGYYDLNSCAAMNEDDVGQPIAFDDIPPVGMAFDGQFLQVDMVGSVPLQ